MKDEIFDRLNQLAPDLMEEMGKRAFVLEKIALNAPVGRRQLAAKMNLPEREVRSLAETLKKQQLVDFQPKGMVLTTQGETLLPFVNSVTKQLRQVTTLEKELAEKLDIHQVYICSGNVDESPDLLKEVGARAAQQLRRYLKDGMVLAVTGGSTIAQVAHHLPLSPALNVMVVPARGGMGRNVAHQANTLAAEIGKKLGGHYRLMHLPDQMDAHAMQEMIRLPEVKETMDLLQRADVILHGVGRADEMSKGRSLPKTVMEQLAKRKAVAESFGYYFDEQGKFLYAASSIGVDLSRLKPKCQMIAVAAGKKKAKALLAVCRHYQHEMLVTDEGAAGEMIRLLNEVAVPECGVAID